jgi:FkbM family methyltransferase
MLNNWLRAARSAAARRIATLVDRFPRLEPGFIGGGRWLARRAPRLGTIYWFAQQDLILRLRQSGRRFRTHQVSGVEMAVDVTDGSARLLHFYGEPYEPQLARALCDRLGPGDVFLDIGANIGYFSTLAGRIVGADGRVVAFEPHPEARSVLQQAIAANRLAGIVEVVPAAVADRGGHVRLFLAGDSVLSTTDPSRAPAREHYAFTESLEVPRISLDEWLAGHQDLLPRIRAIKIDVEGTEADVLRGMGATLRGCPGATILCETNAGSEADLFLRDRGYAAVALDLYGTDLGNFCYERRATDPAASASRTGTRQ